MCTSVQVCRIHSSLFSSGSASAGRGGHLVIDKVSWDFRLLHKPCIARSSVLSQLTHAFAISFFTATCRLFRSSFDSHRINEYQRCGDRVIWPHTAITSIFAQITADAVQNPQPGVRCKPTVLFKTHFLLHYSLSFLTIAYFQCAEQAHGDQVGRKDAAVLCNGCLVRLHKVKAGANWRILTFRFRLSAHLCPWYNTLRQSSRPTIS